MSSNLWFVNPNLKDVTPQNFLSIMKGDKEAMKGIGSGKVIDRWANFIAAEINNLGILAFSKAFQGRKTKWNFKWKHPCIRSIKFVFVCFLTSLMVNFKYFKHEYIAFWYEAIMVASNS